MDNNTSNESFSELEEMRSQIALLKDKLNSEQIVSERLLRETLKSKAGILHNQETAEYISVAVCFVLVPASLRMNGFSWWLIGATLAMVLFSGIMTFVQHRHMQATDMLTADLRTVAIRAKKLKQDYLDWIKWAIILICVWFGWLMAECFLRMENFKVALIFAVACGVGLFIGGSIGMSMHRKVIRTCDDIIRETEVE